MREFTLVQDIAGTVDEHWRTFFDPAFEQVIVKAMKFRLYEVVARDEDDSALTQKTRAVPRWDIAAVLGKLFGASPGYVEEGRFDKAARIWRTSTIPDSLADKITCEMVMRMEPVDDTRSRRVLDFKIEARVRGLGGMVESSLEKNLRNGWRDSGEFISRYIADKRGG